MFRESVKLGIERCFFFFSCSVEMCALGDGDV